MNDLGVIHLTNGGFAVVDADLFEGFNQYRWNQDPKGYVFRGEGPRKAQKKIMLHRVVNQSLPRIHTDHRNGVLIDCTRRNLRTATFVTNGRNRKKGNRKYSSEYKGVSFTKAAGKWRANIKVNGKSISLGYFNGERSAAISYNLAATKHFGEFARLNPL